jgi:hypothetical protein
MPTPGPRAQQTLPPAAPTRVGRTPLAIGSLIVVGACGLVAASGVLPAEQLQLAAVGAATALLAGAAANALQARLLRRVDAARAPGMQLQVALGIGLVSKLAGLALGVLALLAAHVKFTGIAAFALSFAAASLVLQVCSAVLSARALARTADPARTDPSP